MSLAGRASDTSFQLEPQHSASAFACFTAHVCQSPAEMSEYAVPLGASLLPWSLSPKHSAYPVMLRVQVWSLPALMADFSPAGTSLRLPQQRPVRSTLSPHE